MKTEVLFHLYMESEIQRLSWEVIPDPQRTFDTHVQRDADVAPEIIALPKKKKEPYALFRLPIKRCSSKFVSDKHSTFLGDQTFFFSVSRLRMQSFSSKFVPNLHRIFDTHALSVVWIHPKIRALYVKTKVFSFARISASNAQIFPVIHIVVTPHIPYPRSKFRHDRIKGNLREGRNIFSRKSRLLTEPFSSKFISEIQLTFDTQSQSFVDINR